MRVLIINQFFYPDLSATSQLMTDLAADLHAAGFEVQVLCSDVSYTGSEKYCATQDFGGVQITRVAAAAFGKDLFSRIKSYLSFYANAARKIFQLPRMDAIVVLTTPPLLVAVPILYKLFHDTHVVYLMQDIYPDIAVKLRVLNEKGLPARILNAVGNACLKRCDRVVTLGRCMGAKIESKGVDPGKISVFPNWADSRQIREIAQAENHFLREQQLSGKFVVMYSGNMGYGHDFSALLGAATLLRSDSEYVFVFIGDGAQKAQIQQFAKENRLNNILVLPYVQRSDLSFTLSAANVGVVCQADDMHGLLVPSKLYGVMAAARPVLFIGPEETEVGSTVSDSGCGFAIKNGDIGGIIQALEFLQSHPDAAAEMGKRGHRLFKQEHDRPISTGRYVKLLRSLVAEPTADSGYERVYQTKEPT